jgi:hypothetical protein
MFVTKFMIPFWCWFLLSLVDFVDLSCSMSNIQTRINKGFVVVSDHLWMWVSGFHFFWRMVCKNHLFGEYPPAYQRMYMRKVTGAGRIGAQLLLQSTQLKNGQEWNSLTQQKTWLYKSHSSVESFQNGRANGLVSLLRTWGQIGRENVGNIKKVVRSGNNVKSCYKW